MCLGDEVEEPSNAPDLRESAFKPCDDNPDAGRRPHDGRGGDDQGGPSDTAREVVNRPPERGSVECKRKGSACRHACPAVPHRVLRLVEGRDECEADRAATTELPVHMLDTGMTHPGCL